MDTITNPVIAEMPEISPAEQQENMKRLARQGNMLYLALTGAFFTALFILFLFLPRPEYSELEKRDLASFPEWNEYELSAYPEAISEWFSDSQPYRDHFLTMSMSLRNAMKYSFRSDEDAVSFIATAEGMESEAEGAEVLDDRAETEGHDPNSIIAENAKIGNSGVIVAGNAPNARAMMAYGGNENSGKGFISLINNYAKTFPNVTMYAMIVSTAGEFYMPPKVSERNKPQTVTLNSVKASLDPGVKYVDVWNALNTHKAEDIFLRTDHHWAPLGAYYAAKAFAQTAKVTFKNLDSYEKKVVKGIVGSMYGYSKDINIKNSPEDFIYYVPKGIEYKADFINYSANENFEVTKASGPVESEYFKSYPDGSGGAYCTFMGGDRCTVHVKTNAQSARKLLVIKDSYGNAVPGYLFYGFSDIHVVDFRYFNKNMKKYITDNGITDIAFIFSIFKICNSNAMNRVNTFLTQEDGKLATATDKSKAGNTDASDTKSRKKAENAAVTGHKEATESKAGDKTENKHDTEPSHLPGD